MSTAPVDIMKTFPGLFSHVLDLRGESYAVDDRADLEPSVTTETTESQLSGYIPQLQFAAHRAK